MLAKALVMFLDCMCVDAIGEMSQTLQNLNSDIC